jgi:uncharacterized protein YggE
MKTLLYSVIFLVLCSHLCQAQVGGNISYGQAGGRAQAEQNERAKRGISRDEIPPAGSMFLEASVLMNVKADEYVALFGVSQEGATVQECGRKMDAALDRFTGELKQLGIGPNDLYVDFVAQNKIYGYEVTSDIAREKLTGFELKKNVAIHYQDKTLLDRLILAASRCEIYDLIKVDYVVRDTAAVQDRLMTEAARIVKQKVARYERLLGIKLPHPAQVYAEKPSIYYPTEMYDSYVAAESEDVTSGYYRQKYIVQGARKGRTFFFNPLNAKGFDMVINPVVIEPVVQFTLYLKVRYDTASPQIKR